MLADLLSHPGVEEVVALRSSFGIMAFHGGNLERGTDLVAQQAAEASGASYYAVLQPPDLRWHIPSSAVSPDDSARLAEFLAHVEVVVAVHGYGREGLWSTLLAGGANRHLATHLAGALRPLLPGFLVEDDLTRIPRDLRGVHPRNPVNLPPGGGVQLELPPRVRGQTPLSQAWHLEAVIDGLATAARTWPR